MRANSWAVTFTVGGAKLSNFVRRSTKTMIASYPWILSGRSVIRSVEALCQKSFETCNVWSNPGIHFSCSKLLGVRRTNMTIFKLWTIVLLILLATKQKNDFRICQIVVMVLQSKFVVQNYQISGSWQALDIWLGWAQYLQKPKTLLWPQVMRNINILLIKPKFEQKQMHYKIISKPVDMDDIFELICHQILFLDRDQSPNQILFQNLVSLANLHGPGPPEVKILTVVVSNGLIACWFSSEWIWSTQKILVKQPPSGISSYWCWWPFLWGGGRSNEAPNTKFLSLN